MSTMPLSEGPARGYVSADMMPFSMAQGFRHARVERAALWRGSLAALTENWQRLGDLAARTVVLQARRPAA